MSGVELLSACDGADYGVTLIVDRMLSGPYWNAVTRADASSDFLVGSGLARLNQIGNITKLVAIVIGLFIGIWAIIAEFRAWGTESSDSFELFMTVIRASALYFGIVIVQSAIV